MAQLEELKRLAAARAEQFRFGGGQSIGCRHGVEQNVLDPERQRGRRQVADQNANPAAVLLDRVSPGAGPTFQSAGFWLSQGGGTANLTTPFF